MAGDQNVHKRYSILMQDFYNVMQLLCAVLAECFYTGASITFKAIKCLQHHLGPIHPLIFLVQESWWLPTQQGGAWPLDGSSLCNFNHCNLSHLTSFPAWGGSNSTGPCSSSSVRRGRHHDQAVGACQGGMPNEQNHLKEITYTKGTKIPKNPTFSLEFHLSSSSFRMAGRLTSRLTKILECRWIFSFVSNLQSCFQSSAEDLTWSYANILHALHIRKWGSMLKWSFHILPSGAFLQMPQLQAPKVTKPFLPHENIKYLIKTYH